MIICCTTLDRRHEVLKDNRKQETQRTYRYAQNENTVHKTEENLRQKKKQQQKKNSWHK